MNENPNLTPPPPPAHASYPREGNYTMFGSSEKLAKLYRGYQGMNYTVLCGIGTYALLAPGGIVLQMKGLEILGYTLYALPLASFIAMFYFSIRSGMDVAYGNGWAKVPGAILGVVAPFSCIVMCIVIQYLATSEMKKYGIVYRSFRGINGAQVRAIIGHMAAMENPSQPASPTPF